MEAVLISLYIRSVCHLPYRMISAMSNTYIHLSPLHITSKMTGTIRIRIQEAMRAFSVASRARFKERIARHLTFKGPLHTYLEPTRLARNSSALSQHGRTFQSYAYKNVEILVF